MKSGIKRGVSLLLCALMLAGFFLIPQEKAEAAHYTSYSTVTVIKNQGDCYAMQGCDSDDNYIYCTKVNTETETSCVIARVNKSTGDTVFLTNAATGGIYFSQLSHANDLDVVDINGVKTVFVATGGAGEGPYSLVRFALSGTTLTEVAHYDMQYNGASHRIAGAQVMSVEGDNIHMVFLWGKYVYKGTIGVNQKSSAAVMEHVITLDLADVTMNGSKKDLSGFVKQGFEYYDGKIYVPLTGEPDYDISTVTAWDVVGASGTIKNDPDFSVWIADTTFVDLFEIESVTICPSDGKMYFTTNRRKTSSDGNWDGVHYLNNFTYDPSVGDNSASANFRWNVTDGVLFPSNQNGCEYNHAQIIKGTVSGNSISAGQYSLERTVVLKHDVPWVIEWKAANVKNAMIMSTTKRSGYSGNQYLYVRADGLVSMGTYDGSQYNNYGINITNHGYNVTDAHTYTVENRIAADGSNMLYLKVDGKELGAMNQYFVGGTAQNTTNNWVKGKDFKFSYLGTTQHPITGSYTRIIVLGNGYPGKNDEPNTLRWETQSNALTPVSKYDHTNVPITDLFGSVSGTTYTGYQSSLSKNITLLHTRPWSLEWKGNVSGMPFATAQYARTEKASFLYRSSVLAFGRWSGTQFDNYGVRLADHGIDASAVHTYRLTNRIYADGSNMVYLYVDGKEIAPMDTYFVGTTQQSTGSNWVSGKDFSFSHFGTYQFPVNGTLSYIQVWEDGIPEEQTAREYHWTPGTNQMTPSTTAPYTDNPTTILGGSNSGTAMNDGWYQMERSVFLLHNRNWSIEWESEGNWRGSSTGAFLLSASQFNNELNAPYLYRRSNSDLIAFGVRWDGAHNNYGVSLADHGIDGTAKHTYKLENRVHADGSNMVYLYVDGKEIAPMNTYFNGGTNTGTTVNWINGKDFVFNYIGTPRFPIGGCTLSYLTVTEGCTHSYSEWTVTKAATCTTEGMQTRSCTLCGVTQTRTVAVSGHSYKGTVTAPTCSAQGYTTYICSVCGDSYQGDFVAVSGHSYQSTVVEPTCTLQGYTEYTCVFCGYTYQDVYTYPAGHSYRSEVTAPTCTTGGYTTYTCVTCGSTHQDHATAATGHSYVNGSCSVCGAADPDYVNAPNITLRYPTVSFEDEILMNVYFHIDSMDDVWELGLVTYNTQVSAADINTANSVVPGYTYDAASGMLCVTTEGIPAKCLGDEIWFSVYAQLRDGSYVYSRVVSYSPATYAYAQLTASDAKMKPLVVAMLNYGAAAQAYFHYKTDTPVNARLTDAQKALVRDYSADMMAAVTTATTAKQGSFLNNGGYVRRYPTVSFEGAFAINYYFTPSAVPAGTVTMYYWNESDFDSVDVLTVDNATQAITMTGSGTNEYHAAVEGIPAKDLDQGIYVAFCYSDGVNRYASGVLAYSIGTYCNVSAAGNTALTPFAEATAVYGYYARELFYQ